jgi:hypothetical protein
MRKLVLLVVFLFMPCISGFSAFKQVYGVSNAEIKRVVGSISAPAVIYIASDNSLYKSQNKGESFEKKFVFKDEQVKHIFFSPHFAQLLYVVTSRHLYRVNNGLEKLYSSPEGTTLLTAVHYKNRIYIGTTDGLYFSYEDVLNWRNLPSVRGVSVNWIEPVGEGLFLATDKGVYVLTGSSRVRRVFVSRQSEQEDNLIATVVKVDLFNKNRVWLGTNQGVFVSEDRGKQWRKIYPAAISRLKVNCFAQLEAEKDVLYVGTARGLFKVDFKNNSLQHIFEGLHSSQVNWIEVLPSGEVYLATPKGIFKNNHSLSCKGYSLPEILAQEPSIEEIQQAALRYNDVHPDKIRRWQNRLKYRALFPTITLDYDKTVGYSVSKYGSYFDVGPRDWGISFSWDVGDLIWNSYQDDVDTRSRLNTQLRLDILDEINRLYFERLRLKQEIIASSLPEEKLFQKKLRLAELTAVIDAYTGGYFSRRVKELNKQ